MNKSHEKIKIGIASEKHVNEEFIDAWYRAINDEINEPEESLYFIDPKTFLNIISDKRLTILYTLRSHGKTDIHNLSNTLRRNYNDVYHDVQLLKQAGLIKQSISEAISVPWDIIQTEIKLTAL